MGTRLYRFLVDEWLLLVSLIGLITTSLYLKHWPHYTWRDGAPVFLLYALFVSVKGIEKSRLLLGISGFLEKSHHVPLILVITTFFLSMFLTIDVSLVTMLPIVLSMHLKQKGRLVILVALTAHAGAALTPFGTPQNLFIYTYYDPGFIPFLKAIAPFSFGLLFLYLLAALFMGRKPATKLKSGHVHIERPKAFVWILLLGIVVLSTLHLLPAGTALFAPLYALLIDRRSLKVDYALLLTFLAFIGLTSNIKALIGGTIEHPGHIFLLSSLTSQVLSNVPTTLLFEKFTSQWQALLWGTNVGGYGTLVAAIANLITYRIYRASAPKNVECAFLRNFTLAGFLSFFAGFVIHFMLYNHLYRF
ncbi:SLC13 family permease [Hydrogenimonas sp. SS33]|uniref:SLC13 family permease n=1 Tax=Hydrogenimonas leucolamina TaxID=2954236 RepID=UPI00336BDE14